MVKQEAFVESIKVLRDELDEQSVLYFADAAHPQRNMRSAYAWTEKGLLKETPLVSGRKRLNCNGAMNPFDVCDREVRFDACINAQITWLLYELLAQKHPDKDFIYVVCDNARYYKNK